MKKDFLEGRAEKIVSLWWAGSSGNEKDRLRRATAARSDATWRWPPGMGATAHLFQDYRRPAWPRTRAPPAPLARRNHTPPQFVPLPRRLPTLGAGMPRSPCSGGGRDAQVGCFGLRCPLVDGDVGGLGCNGRRGPLSPLVPEGPADALRPGVEARLDMARTFLAPSPSRLRAAHGTHAAGASLAPRRSRLAADESASPGAPLPIHSPRAGPAVDRTAARRRPPRHPPSEPADAEGCHDSSADARRPGQDRPPRSRAARHLDRPRPAEGDRLVVLRHGRDLMRIRLTLDRLPAGGRQ